MGKPSYKRYGERERQLRHEIRILCHLRDDFIDEIVEMASGDRPIEPILADHKSYRRGVRIASLTRTIERLKKLVEERI